MEPQEEVGATVRTCVVCGASPAPWVDCLREEKVFGPRCNRCHIIEVAMTENWPSEYHLKTRQNEEPPEEEVRGVITACRECGGSFISTSPDDEDLCSECLEEWWDKYMSKPGKGVNFYCDVEDI